MSSTPEKQTYQTPTLEQHQNYTITTGLSAVIGATGFSNPLEVLELEDMLK